MSDAKARFDAAVAASKLLTKRPDNATLLALYANFKQATEGDVKGERPDMFDRVGCAKYDAWEALEGTYAEAAMERYAQIVERLAGE